MPQDLVDCAFCSVLLKLEERLPDSAIKQRCFPQFIIGLPGLAQELFKQVVERLVVDELGRMVDVKLLEMTQDVFLDVLYQLLIAPYLAEPLLEFGPVSVAVDEQVEFNVVMARLSKPESLHCEVGAAHDGVIHALVVDVVHFPVEQIALFDSFDRHFRPNPFGALPGDPLLLKLV